MQFIKDMEEFTVEELMEMVQDVNDWDGRFDLLKVYENDEEFFDMVFPSSPYELVQKISYGSYNFSEAYVRVDGYGNLESLSSYEYEKEIQDHRYDILDSYKELVEDNSIDDWSGYLEEEDC